MKKFYIKKIIISFLLVISLAITLTPVVVFGNTKINIKIANITLSKNTYIYNGKYRKPKVTVLLDNKKISKKNYTIKYQNNKNIGIATVIIKGKNNFTGETKRYFKINGITKEKSDVPQLFQWNYSYIPYSGSNVSKCGCGITSFTMIAQYFKGRKGTPTIKQTANWSQNKYLSTGDKSYLTNKSHQKSFKYLAKQFGIKYVKNINNPTISAVKEYLQKGYLMIANYRNNPVFNHSRYGHYVVLSGVTLSGKILVNDPAHPENCKAHSISTIKNHLQIVIIFRKK